MRIQYYTDTFKHMGWTKWDCPMKYAEVQNWIRSGNYIKAHGYFIRNLEEYSLFCKIYG